MPEAMQPRAPGQPSMPWPWAKGLRSRSNDTSKAETSKKAALQKTTRSLTRHPFPWPGRCVPSPPRHPWPNEGVSRKSTVSSTKSQPSGKPDDASVAAAVSAAEYARRRASRRRSTMTSSLLRNTSTWGASSSPPAMTSSMHRLCANWDTACTKTSLPASSMNGCSPPRDPRAASSCALPTEECRERSLLSSAWAAGTW